MIKAFQAMANAAPDQRQKRLGEAIALAMNTTAFGLIVAISCMIFHLVLSGVTKKIIDEIDLYAVKLENFLISRHSFGK
jgi:biopolymer transport protein ExbB/TolQ